MIEFIKNWWIDKWRGNLLGGVRSPRWSQVRKTNIKKECECCGKKGTLFKPCELHHILPFHISPENELNPENFLTVCRDCHYLLCHLRDWKSWNKDIKKNAAELLFKIKNRPY